MLPFLKKKPLKVDILESIVEYVIGEMRPLSVVEKPPFRKLVQRLANIDEVQIPCRKTVKTTIDEMRAKLTNDIIKILEQIPYVCTTADIWSSMNKAYFGVTCHFIDPETYLRKSFMLSCKRIKHSHDHVAIANALFEVHKTFKITKSTVGTVTDNAKNFSKAFQVFSTRDDIPEDLDFLEDNCDDVIVYDLPDFDSISDDNDDFEVHLPRQYRCFSHTVNLIATKDVELALQNSKYKKIYYSTIGKLTSIWNLSHYSTKAADAIEEIVKKKLITPNATRWMSFYNSVRLILELKSHMGEICDRLDKPKIKLKEFEFLHEYCDVIEPLAKALKILEGENDCHLGHVLPMIRQIKEDIAKFRNLGKLNNLT